MSSRLESVVSHSHIPVFPYAISVINFTSILKRTLNILLARPFATVLLKVGSSMRMDGWSVLDKREAMGRKLVMFLEGELRFVWICITRA